MANNQQQGNQGGQNDPQSGKHGTGSQGGQGGMQGGSTSGQNPGRGQFDKDRSERDTETGGSHSGQGGGME